MDHMVQAAQAVVDAEVEGVLVTMVDLVMVLAGGRGGLLLHGEATTMSRVGRLVEGLRRRLYSKEVSGRVPGPRRRAGAVMSSTAHQGGKAAAYRLSPL
jgi:hypothetical protein